MPVSPRFKKTAAARYMAAAQSNRQHFIDLYRQQFARIFPMVPLDPSMPLQKMYPSAKLQPIRLPADAVPEGFWPCNPSIVSHRGSLLTTVRCVNYQLPGSRPDAHSVNLLAHLADDLSVRHVKEMRDLDASPRVTSTSTGYEDIRLFSLGGKLGASATVLDRNLRRIQMALLELTDDFDIAHARVQETLERAEKNWMPVILPDGLRWIYSVDPTVVRSLDGEVARHAPFKSIGMHHGSSQLVPYQGGYLAVVHRSTPPWQPVYLHKFVAFDEGLHVVGISHAFYFMRQGVEFCAGMARHPRSGKLILSFGINDAEAWLAEVDEVDVLRAL